MDLNPKFTDPMGSESRLASDPMGSESRFAFIRAYLACEES